MDIREYGRPPKPNEKHPFVQIDWIFNIRADRTATSVSSANYRNALTVYKAHISSTYGNHPYYLREQWDTFALLRFKEELETRCELGEISYASYTLVGLFSCVRQVMEEAAAYGLLDCKAIQAVGFGNGEPETDGHACYSESELAQILDAMATELHHTFRVLAGYQHQPVDAGQDPRIERSKGATNGYGFKVEANIRWYFEHVLGAKPIIGDKLGLKLHHAFVASASNDHGGIHNMYHRWGVSAYIDIGLVMPLAVSLLHLTGLNPSSLLSLRTDCYRDEHPLTGMPYLLFEKVRSQGEKELHLPLLEPRDERALKRKQSAQVKRTIDRILELTGPLREALPLDSEVRQRLFVFQSSGPRAHRELLALKPPQTSSWCRQMVKKYNLHADDGSELQFNLVRFRSTKLTEMALEGRDLFEIQQVARHKSIAQTVRYIAINRLDIPARKIVANALEKIKSNRDELLVEVSPTNPIKRPIHLFKGLISDCKNVFDPPEWLKRTMDYIAGQPCTRFNMCLFCHNVVIMLEHLPLLTAYRAQILAAQANNVQNLPHASFYDRSLAVIDNLLDPETGEFTREEIEWAIEESVRLDIFVDPLIYRGTCS